VRVQNFLKGSRTVSLKAKIKPTVAFYVYDNISRLVLAVSSTTTLKPLREICFTAAQVSSISGYIASALSDSTQLQAIMSIDALHDTAEQLWDDSNIVVTAPAVQPSQRPLLLFVQLLVAEVLVCRRSVSGSKDVVALCPPGDVERAEVGGVLQTLTHTALSENVLQHGFSDLTQLQSDAAAAQQEHIGQRLMLLRSAFLLLKLASLLSSFNSIVNRRNILDMLRPLLSAVQAITQAMEEHSGKCRTAGISTVVPDRLAEEQQEEQLSMFLVQMVMSSLRYDITGPKPPGAIAPMLVPFLDILFEEVPDATFQALASQVLGAGQPRITHQVQRKHAAHVIELHAAWKVFCTALPGHLN